MATTAPFDILFPGHELDDGSVRAFLAGEIGPEALAPPRWGPLGKEVFERTYAREVVDPDNPGSTRKEHWAETVRRVVLGNLGYAPRWSWLPDEDVELFKTIYTLRAIPAGRHLWVTGVPEVSAYSRNCYVSGYGKRLSDHFAFLAARLFEGGGVGANYSADVRSKTPSVAGSVAVLITCRPDHTDIEAIVEAASGSFVSEAPDGVEVIAVSDTREGWVEAWSRIIDLATEQGEHKVVLDLSGLRPYGAPLRRFGGKASGPAPLARSSLAIAGILTGARGKQLSGLETMQIDHEIAASVVAGGTRRSARLALMNWRDPEVFDFISCKADQMSHWSANISVEIDRAFREALASGDAHAKAVFEAVCVGMARNGEPGLIDTGLASETEPIPLRAVNPCGEAFLTTDQDFGAAAVGDAAGEACNLGQIDLDAFGTDDEAALEAFRLMARFLYRATLRQHPSEPARRIESRNRRIGVGIMGVQGWCAAHGRRLTELPSSQELLDKLVSYRLAVRTAADELASQLGTPRSVKVTAVAPTGTISNLRGTTPGPHPVFARYFIRRVRFAEHDPAWRRLAEQGYEVVDDIYAAATKVVSFPMRDSVLDRHPAELIEQADEVSVSQFLDIVAAVQATYCGSTDGQAVSATAQVPADIDPSELVDAIAPRLGRLKGVTVFPAVSRALPPMEAISAERYVELTARSGSAAVGDSSTGCINGACPVR